MKKSYVLLVIILVLFAFIGCNQQEVNTNTQKADSITIFYGVSSYAMLSSDVNTIKTLTDCFNNLSFEPTGNKMDMQTMLSVSFLKGGKRIAKFSVDKNGVFWINGETNCLKVASGTFSYDIVKDIYEKSKKIKK